jgi:hypothetical protein
VSRRASRGIVDRQHHATFLLCREDGGSLTRIEVTQSWIVLHDFLPGAPAAMPGEPVSTSALLAERCPTEANPDRNTSKYF